MPLPTRIQTLNNYGALEPEKDERCGSSSSGSSSSSNGSGSSSSSSSNDNNGGVKIEQSVERVIASNENTGRSPTAILTWSVNSLNTRGSRGDEGARTRTATSYH